jgi:hypothetical protein
MAKSHGADAMDVPQRMLGLAGERDEAMCSTTACQGWSVDRSVNWGARNAINDLHFISSDRRVRSRSPALAPASFVGRGL